MTDAIGWRAPVDPERRGGSGVGAPVVGGPHEAGPLGRRRRSIALAALLGRLDLRPVDAATARLAVVLGAAYGLRAADAVHLATAVAVGADRFVTNNRRDFTSDIVEIDVVHPDALPDPDGAG